MDTIYQPDLAFIHAIAFGGLATGAAPEIVHRLKSSSTPIRRILEIGCGAGPLTKALTHAGFEVTAIDTSYALLEFARKQAPTAHFIHASAYDIDIQNFDAVIAVGEPLTYHSDPTRADHDLNRFFTNAANALPAGGMLIFDVIGLGLPSLAARTWNTSEDWGLLIETTENQSTRTLVREIEIFRSVNDLYRRSREIHHVRLFEIMELCDQLASLGFSVETARSYGSQPLLPRRHALFATRQSRP
jgi:SAM-dependent methyltransferase